MQIASGNKKERQVTDGGQGVGFSHQAPAATQTWQVATLQELKRLRDQFCQQGSLQQESDYGIHKVVCGQGRYGQLLTVVWSIPFALQSAEDTAYQSMLPLDFDKEFSRFSETQF